MTTEQERDTPPAGPWDGVIGELRKLRHRAGDPSFRLIAQRVAEQRIADGLDEHAARIATSSVHDAFRLGRRRINLPLVHELARALGADETVVHQWLVGPEPVDAMDADPSAKVVADLDSAAAHGPAQGVVAVLMVCCVALNLLGRVFVDQLHLPIYLDMTGTAIAAIGVGPWRGAAVGLVTNVAGVWTSGVVSLDFAVVNAAGGLVWGYGVTAWGWGRTLPRFAALNVVVGAVCSALAVPILWLAFGPHLRFGQDLLTRVLEQSVHPFLVAEATANLMTSVADKTISGFFALVVLSAIPSALPTWAALPIARPG